MSSLTMLQSDTSNEIGKKMYLVKNSQVENVPHKNHTNLNYLNCIQKMNIPP